jgi:hypothetical protein
VSNHRNIAVLSHHQPAGARTGTFIAPEIAEQLLQRMAAEKISAKVIRMMSPDSIFLPAVQEVRPGTSCASSNLNFGAGEICGARFRAPSDPAWQELHGPATHSLRIRSWMALKGWKQLVAASTDKRLARMNYVRVGA